MAYQPDDDRFYQSLNRAGQTYLDQRGKVAEDQAATTRELGNIYGQALPNTVNAGLSGAQWAQNRAAQQQKMDVTGSSEQRAQHKFAEDQQDRQAAQASAARQEAYDSAPAEESFARGAGVEYQPGMTHKDVERLAGANQLGFKDRQLTSEEQRAKDNRDAEMERLGVTEKGSDRRLGITQGGENDRAQASIKAAADRQQEMLALDREKLDQEKSLKLAEMGNKPATAEQLNSANFGRKAQDAAKALDVLESGTFDPASKGAALRTTHVPFTDYQPLANDTDRSYDVAKREFLAAVLRKESGAAIGKDEMAQYGDTYFPKAGDSKDVKDLKAARRKAIAENYMAMAGDKASGQIPNHPYAVNVPGGDGDNKAIAAPKDTYPRKVMKGNVSATVSNPQELQEAMSEGFQ